MTDRIDRVIITGAGSGIGLDMARAFLARGSRLVINGRDPDKLERARRTLGDSAPCRATSAIPPPDVPWPTPHGNVSAASTCW